MAHKRREMIEHGESGDIDMSPMIDMVFLLLIFFIVNATAITVKPDMSVKMPIANDPSEVKSANGAIVVNVYSDEVEAKKGTRWSDDEGNPLRTKEDLARYISDMTTKFERYKEDPGWVLYLRGDQEGLYKNSKTVIEVAAQGGVPKIMFATHKKQ